MAGREKRKQAKESEFSGSPELRESVPVPLEPRDRPAAREEELTATYLVSIDHGEYSTDFLVNLRTFEPVGAQEILDHPDLVSGRTVSVLDSAGRVLMEVPKDLFFTNLRAAMEQGTTVFVSQKE